MDSEGPLEFRIVSGIGGAGHAVTGTLGTLLGDAGGKAGFLEAPRDHRVQDSVRAVLDELDGRFTRLLVLGIGGSGLGATAALDALGRPKSEVRVLSNIDPRTVRDVLDWYDPADTLVNVVTKSGTTVETLSQLAIFAGAIEAWGGSDALAEGVVATTGEGALRKMAVKAGWRVLDVPPRVGGRFSVLTPVGLFPMAFAGIDVAGVLAGARDYLDAMEGPGGVRMPAAVSASWHAALMESGIRTRALWTYCDRLGSFGDWFCQLWAESLGKRRAGGRTGQTPVSAMGTTDQHSLLQLFMDGPADACFTFLTVGGPWPGIDVPDRIDLDPVMQEFAGKGLLDIFDALRTGTMAALAGEGRPVAHLHLSRLDAYGLGALFAHFEVETALAGYILGIDPFDQPGVETGKLFAHGLLGKPGMESYRDRALSLLGIEREE